MTYRGVHRDTQTCEPAKHHKKELPDGQFKDIKSLEVGVQIPRCIYTEVSKEKSVQGIESRSWKSVSRVSEVQSKVR